LGGAWEGRKILLGKGQRRPRKITAGGEGDRRAREGTVETNKKKIKIREIAKMGVEKEIASIGKERGGGEGKSDQDKTVSRSYRRLNRWRNPERSS